MATIESQGCTLKLGDGASPEVFTAAGEVRTIAGPSGSATVIDISNLDSTAREKRLGLPDEGQVTVGLAYDSADTQQENFRTRRAARSSDNYQIVLSDSPATTFSFTAFVQEFSLDLGVDEVLLLNVTLEISGSVTKS